MDVQKILRTFGTKNFKFIAAVIIAGILVIFLSDMFPQSAEKDTHADSSNAEYISSLEARVKNIVSSIDGAGACEVMITLESGAEQIIATESRENKTQSSDSGRVSEAHDTQRSVITVSSGNAQTPVVVRQDEPKIRGVVIACEGGGDNTTVLKITDAVRTLFSVPSGSICVIKLSK